MTVVFGAQGLVHNVELFLEELLLFSKQEKIVVQALDAQLVYGKDHMVSAVLHAKRAVQQRTNATNSLALEILLYAAGERQIQKAIKKMGVKKGKHAIVFILLGNENKKISDAVVVRLLKKVNLTRDDKVLEGGKDTLLRFGITNDEIRTVSEERYVDLILEKVAMVDIIK